MTFKERMQYLGEVRRKNTDMSKHPNGTYMSVTLSAKSQKTLDEWVTNNNIPNPADPKQYHTTIVYSRRGVPEVEDYKIKLPINASIKEWKIFSTQSNTQCLVAIMDSEQLTNDHNTIKQRYGATHDYPDYHPHVTVSYDFGSNTVPSEVPSMELNYDKVEIKPLDPQFVPPKKESN